MENFLHSVSVLLPLISLLLLVYTVQIQQVQGRPLCAVKSLDGKMHESNHKAKKQSVKAKWKH